MSSEIINTLSESGVSVMNFKETELTLGLPGVNNSNSYIKRGFSETVDLTLGNSGRKDPSGNGTSKKKESVASKTQVVGWPPVRTHRKNIMTVKSGKYVKVGMDGAPYLRKVDLEMYKSYEELLSALEKLFSFIGNNVVTYEDKDGDWMLVGDVPWKMFAESCKRVRLMARSEAIGLAPTPEPKCSSSSC